MAKNSFVELVDSRKVPPYGVIHALETQEELLWQKY